MGRPLVRACGSVGWAVGRAHGEPITDAAFRRLLRSSRVKRRIVLIIVGCVLLYLGLSYGPQVWAPKMPMPDLLRLLAAG
jgi:hypothetical protein